EKEMIRSVDKRSVANPVKIQGGKQTAKTAADNHDFRFIFQHLDPTPVLWIGACYQTNHLRARIRRGWTLAQLKCYFLLRNSTFCGLSLYYDTYCSLGGPFLVVAFERTSKPKISTYFLSHHYHTY